MSSPTFNLKGAIVILTSGGDSPGMNAVMHGIAAEALSLGLPLFGSRCGYKGLINEEYEKITFAKTSSQLEKSGTFIGSSRCPEFKNSPECREKVARQLLEHGIKLLVVIGGDGSYRGALKLKELNVPVLAIPGTIDNDVGSTKYTVGFFSAFEEICNALRKVRQTSNSHAQITFVEVMGRDCHDLSAFAGIAGNVDCIITQDNAMDIERLKGRLSVNPRVGKKGVIFLVSEKVYGKGFACKLPPLSEVVKEIEDHFKVQTRYLVLGHTQRGADPTYWEIFMAIRYGQYAIEQFDEKGLLGAAIGFDGGNFYHTELSSAVEQKQVNKISLIKFQNSIFGLL